MKELVFPKALDLDRPKRLRTTFSKEQLDALESVFKIKQYVIKVWFQNRRTKHKKEEELGSLSIGEGVSPLLGSGQSADSSVLLPTPLTRFQKHSLAGSPSTVATTSPLAAPLPLFFPGSLFSLQQMAGGTTAATVSSNGSADTESVSPPAQKQNIFRPFCL
ncbi:hypothetical protein BIW11_04297 [Tropilaelaps mercedesae]|uniref:Homeobox domain-containing protein n=1 Tax=Tropilaelaps mercedesae TaxID=418985 RepID=A0A1V9X8Q7_9ACAR|nr:hypothetical protein BIW11_04297 [Tropilaelaps mercedesae]